MGDRTGIEWTDATWNPTTGCTEVSPGCDHCYAKTITERFHGPGSFANVQLHPDRLDKPLRWRRPRRVFVNSMSDLFHDQVPDDYIARVFAVMALAPQHTFQVLTKRHGRMRSLLNSGAFEGAVDHNVIYASDDDGVPSYEWPLPNVWLGVSVEDQKWANIRIPALLDTPAVVRFISAEPLLGRVDLIPPVKRWADGEAIQVNKHLHWVIVGGESGRGARPMHPDWARSLRDQCTAAGVAFLFKQWGEWVEHQNPGEPGDFHHQFADGALLRRIGKKAAGRELDGHIWDEYPQSVGS